MRYPGFNLAAQRRHHAVAAHRHGIAFATVEFAVFKNQLQVFLQHQVVARSNRGEPLLIPTRHRHTDHGIPKIFASQPAKDRGRVDMTSLRYVGMLVDFIHAIQHEEHHQQHANQSGEYK